MPEPKDIVRSQYFPNALGDLREGINETISLLSKAIRVLTSEIDIDRQLEYKKDKSLLWKSQQDLIKIHKKLTIFLNNRLY